MLWSSPKFCVAGMVASAYSSVTCILISPRNTRNGHGSNAVPVLRTLIWQVGGQSGYPAHSSSRWTMRRMTSTTSGLAREVVSPTSWPLEMAARIRRMILPERVLGRSGTM